MPHTYRHQAFWRTLVVGLAVFLAASTIVAWYAYLHIGKTPGELMDYVDHRLQGHSKLEAVAHPAISVVRALLGEESLRQRRLRKFVIAPPPPLTQQANVPQNVEAKNANIQNRHASVSQPRTWRVGPFEEMRSIALAAKQAKDGDTVEILAGEYHGDVALWQQKKLTIRGVGGNARLFANGRSAEGKAIWVIRNGDFNIENIDFLGAKVEDRNGAGIRFENGHLRIKNCLFWGNENGLLTTNSETAQLEIENSEFGYNGIGDGFTHNLYVGRMATLRVTGSYFHHANVGHLLKSRAARTEIMYNRLTDESGGRASYELDLPNGGVAVIVGNIIQQNRDTDNSTLIAYGMEGLAWPQNKIYLASNTLVNDHPYGGTFLRATPAVGSILTANNLLIGRGAYQTPGGAESSNDIWGEWALFVQASRYDYRLRENGPKYPYQPPPRMDDGGTLVPQREYRHSHQTRLLNAPPIYAGALQMN